MKRLFLIVFLTFTIALPVNAADINNSYDENITGYFDQYGIDLYEIKNNPVGSIWQIIKSSIYNITYKPFKCFFKLTVILMISSLINLFSSSETENVIKLVNIVSLIVIIANIYDEFKVIVDNISRSFFEIKNFMVTFLPVFAGVSFASGEMITSTVYTGMFLVCVVTVANICINYIIPSINIYMAIGMTSTISDIVNLKPLCEFYSKAVKTVMTVAVSVICFVLNMQTTITQAQDTMAVKTGKMIVTSAVPIIGSTLQGAVGSIYASMGVLKGFCGLAGIAVVISIMLPHIINLVVNWIGYYLMITISNIFQNTTAADMLSVFCQVTEIMLSVSVLFIVLLLFSLSIMIKMFQGV